MKPGDTFFGKLIGSGEHLHVILSNPSKTGHAVVLTLISTYDENYKNDTCILRSSDGHPFIKHFSYVAYELAMLYPVAELESYEKSGEIKRKQPFSAEVLQRILQGADRTSARLPDACWIELDNQGLIPR